MKSIILVPARFASSRYPGKPLVELTGASGTRKPLIQRSFEAASRVAGVLDVYVVTDDERIADACAGFGAPVIMTSPECRNGTERCAEALAQVGDADLLINVQGDALLTPPSFVEALIDHCASNPEAMVATPAIRLGSDEVRELLIDEARGIVGGTSVVVDSRQNALYFSKRLIPHLPQGALDSQLSPVRFHVGVYCYRREALDRYAATPETELERLEGLEQLRFLVAGIPVAVVEVERPSFALRELNNPEDVPAIEQALATAGID
ncbi:MAG TPA: manno-octulosonate cytidylyltransferase [Sphingomicrobium sp.]|jgi:3-deoxy-manno-octulosonate cytidylyltransferase (CMP-KDO synthetase)